ncbi:MAG: hypothetical protein AAGU05_04605 [Anaerolineaceae bacterium]
MTLPYLAAPKLAGEENSFGGFLLNPLDGNSYLAKMQEGYAGDWFFALPYTPDHTDGAFLFEFYLLLGHISRWVRLPLLTVFHLARIVSIFLFLYFLDEFLQKRMGLSGKPYALSALLICFGSGLGWIFLVFGQMTSDLWVADAYPFLSAYTNPHFILGMAILLAILTRLETAEKKDLAAIWLLGVLLAIIIPFGSVIAGLIAAGREIWRWFEQKRMRVGPPLAILLGAGVMVLFQYWQIFQDPMLAKWNEQNITPVMPLWDVVVSFSPALLLAAAEIFFRVKSHRIDDAGKVLTLWAVSSLALAVIPFSLQRRFLFTAYIPLAILAVQGIFSIAAQKKRNGNRLFFFVFISTVLTNIFIILMGLSFVKSGNPAMMVSQDEKAAMQWISSQATERDIVLCSPRLGNFVPAITGAKVMYGHPFETVDAETRKQEVIDFYSARQDLEVQNQYLMLNSIDWVIFGLAEASLGRPVVLDELPVVYRNDTVIVYQAAP